MLQLVAAGRRRHVEHLPHGGAELVEGQRPVVEGRGQAEAVLDERLLARAVAGIHAPDLRDGDVGLVDEDEGILGQVVHEGGRLGARLAAGQMPRVVLDAVAVADLPEHLHVEEGALLQPLRLQQPVARAEEGQPLPQLLVDIGDGALDLVGRRDVVAGGIDAHRRHHPGGGALQGIEGHDAIHAVAEELDAERLGLGGGGEHLHHVAAHPERPPPEVVVVPLVLDGDQVPDQRVPAHRLPRLAPPRACPGRSPARRCRRCRTPTPRSPRPAARRARWWRSAASGRSRR